MTSHAEDYDKKTTIGEDGQVYASKIESGAKYNLTPECELVGVAQVGLDKARDRYQEVMDKPWNWGSSLGGVKTMAIEQAERDLEMQENFWDVCVEQCRQTKMRG